MSLKSEEADKDAWVSMIFRLFNAKGIGKDMSPSEVRNYYAGYTLYSRKSGGC
tara:strand:+ start:704 stop:862 length:159 start_codon:yes stop_codon:yes gene_type:complete